MDVEQENMFNTFEKFDLRTSKKWINDVKGLRKEIISIQFVSMQKVSELSRCLVSISELNGLGDRKSHILKPGEGVQERWIDIGTAATPIDCYLEDLLKQMLVNEKSKCFINCKNTQVTFNMHLLKIEDEGYYFTKSPQAMLEIAKRYKESGVAMFPSSVLFAHRAFSNAAKCLLAYAPLEYLDPTIEGADTIIEMKALLEIVYLNISACLIKQNRFEEVLQVLDFINHKESPPEKAIYRKALAQFNIKQYQEALDTLKRINYSAHKECASLHRKIVSTWQKEEKNYNEMIKNMFK